MRFGFSYIGLIWLIMLFVPNMIWTKNKPQDYEKYVESENKVQRIELLDSGTACFVFMHGSL